LQLAVPLYQHQEHYWLSGGAIYRQPVAKLENQLRGLLMHLLHPDLLFHILAPLLPRGLR
jgi:hypothetical protein